MKRPIAVLAALALSAAGLASAVPAEAAATCVLGTPVVTPSTTVAVGLSGGPPRTLTIKATNCTAAQAKALKRYWVLQVGDCCLGDQPYPALKPTSTSGTTTTFKATMIVPSWFFNDWAGVYQTDIYRDNPIESVKRAPDLTVLRRTAWNPVGVNATPEPVTKGKTLTIKGRLFIANWEKKRYDGFSNRSIALEFRTATGTYHQVKTTTSRSGGYVSTTVTATQDGVWRFRYGGNSYAGGATAIGDSVNVR